MSKKIDLDYVDKAVEIKVLVQIKGHTTSSYSADTIAKQEHCSEIAPNLVKGELRDLTRDAVSKALDGWQDHLDAVQAARDEAEAKAI